MMQVVQPLFFFLAEQIAPGRSARAGGSSLRIAYW